MNNIDSINEDDFYYYKYLKYKTKYEDLKQKILSELESFNIQNNSLNQQKIYVHPNYIQSNNQSSVLSQLYNLLEKPNNKHPEHPEHPEHQNINNTSNFNINTNNLDLVELELKDSENDVNNIVQKNIKYNNQLENTFMNNDDNNHDDNNHDEYANNDDDEYDNNDDDEYANNDDDEYANNDDDEYDNNDDDEYDNNDDDDTDDDDEYDNDNDEDNNNIIQISIDNFDSIIKKYTTKNNKLIILFYRPGCPFCDMFMPTYIKFSNTFNKKNIFISMIDTGINSLEKIDIKYRQYIEGVPTILKISENSNTIEKFENDRTIEQLNIFAI